MFFAGRLEESRALGSNYEKNIAPQFFADLGWSCQSATGEQNWRDHFDYTATKGSRSLKVEVKAPKVCKSSCLSSLILLEHTGVTGMPGWLQGKADVILQFMSEKSALCYFRDHALKAYPLTTNEIQRCHSYNAPIGEWFGRSGQNNKNMPNQDIIRWQTLPSFKAAMPILFFYEKKDSRWEAYYH